MRNKERTSSFVRCDAAWKFLRFPLIPVLLLAWALAAETGRAQTLSGTYSGGMVLGGAGADGGGGGAGLGGGIFLSTGQTLTLDAVTLQGYRAQGGAGGSVGGNDNGGGGGVGFGGQQIVGVTGGGVGGGGSVSGGAGSYGRAGFLILGGGSGGAGGSGSTSGGGGGGVDGVDGVDSSGGNGGSVGGFGGFGGGGGGGGGILVGGGGGLGGLGGFGGGGGGGGSIVGSGGVGGGNGGGGVGGGGAAFGGAVFVQSGASLTVTGTSTFNGNSVTAGSGGVAAGSDIFLQSGTSAMTLTLSPGAGNTITFEDADSISDDSAASILAAATAQSLAAGNYGAGTGVGAVVAVRGGGTVVFQQDNSYAGGTLIDGDGSGGTTTLQIQNNASLGIGAVTLGSVGVGGVLQFGASGLNVANDMVLGAFGGTVDTDTHDATLSGTLSGAGSLAKTGTGILTLTGANTYAGGITVSAGTLALSGAGSLASTGAVDVGAAGTFDLSAITASGTTIGDLSGAAGAVVNLGGKSLTVGTTADSTFDGLIEGASGSLVKQGAGTLTLTGVNTYTGGTTIQGGMLAIGSATALGTGTLTFNGSGTALQFGASVGISNNVTLTTGGIIDTVGNDASFHGGLSGAGGLTVTDSSGTNNGIVDLQGTNTYAGLTKVDSGLLIVSGSGSIDGSSGVELGSLGSMNIGGAGGGIVVGAAGAGTAGTLTVNSGGTFGGAGTLIGNVIVNSGGILAPGDPATTTINGNLTLHSGSQTVVTIASTSSYDQIAVIGTGHTAALGGTLVVNPVSGYAPRSGDSFQFLTATGGVTGTFDTVQNGLGNALKYALSYDPMDVTFTLSASQGSFTPFAANPNQAALAHILNQVAGDSREANLFNALNALPGSSLPAAFQQIVPIQQTAAVQTSVQTSHAAFNTLGSRMDAIRMGSNGLSLSQFNLMDQNIPGSALIAGTELPTGIKAFTPAPDNRWGFFAAANGNFGDIDGQTSQSNYYGGGFTVGSDYRLDQSFAVGFAAGYDYSKTDFDHSGSDSVADSIRFGPYATWKDRTGDWVEGAVGGAVHFYDSNRDAFGGTASSSTTGVEFDSSLKYGHDFHLKQWTLTPTFGFDYLHLDIGGYNETGSLAPLSIQDQSIDSFRSNLGGTVAYAFKWMDIGWNPYVSAGWAHEFLDASQSVNARFASGAGDTFSTTGDNLGRDSATFGAGLSADLTEKLTASLFYSGEANDRYQDHSFNAAVRVKF